MKIEYVAQKIDGSNRVIGVELYISSENDTPDNVPFQNIAEDFGILYSRVMGRSTPGFKGEAKSYSWSGTDTDAACDVSLRITGQYSIDAPSFLQMNIIDYDVSRLSSVLQMLYKHQDIQWSKDLDDFVDTVENQAIKEGPSGIDFNDWDGVYY